jgi:glycosyltransferase involved in cell wall biosynthesis
VNIPSGKHEGGTRLRDPRIRTRPGKPLVSIITVVYNGERYLEPAIRSVLGQTYDNLEYLIVDGDSTDASLDIIRKYEDRIDYWVSEPDEGISDAMNKGVLLSRGEIVAHLHADDHYASESVVLSVQKAFSRDQGAKWLTGGMYIIGPDGNPLQEIRVREYSYDRLTGNNIILHPSTFIRREAIERVGLFDRSLKYAMDYDLWMRLGAIGDPITIDEPLSCFRAHARSRSIVSCDSAFFEEWTVRKKFLMNNRRKMLYHYFLYHVNKYGNRRFCRSVTPDGAAPRRPEPDHSVEGDSDSANPHSK